MTRKRKSRQIENLHVTHLAYGGMGVATAEDGRKILIKGALPDSVVDVQIVRKKKDYSIWHISHIHSIDQKWLDGEVKCPHYVWIGQSPETLTPTLSQNEREQSIPEHKTWCGGCKRQSVSYASQLLLKMDILRDCFAGLSHHLWREVGILDILWSPLQFGYRNKIEFSFGKFLVRDMPSEEEAAKEDQTLSKAERVSQRGFRVAEHRQLGMHKQGEFSKVVDVDQCYLVSARMHAIYMRLKADVKESGLPVYDAKQNDWFLRHMVIREWVHTWHILVNMSIATDRLVAHPKHAKIWQGILKKWKQDPEVSESITTMILTNNNGKADVVRGVDVTQDILRGEGKIYEELIYTNIKDESNTILRFGISSFSFFQTNTLAAEVLFQTSADMIGEVRGNVIDMYCGGGSIGQSLLALGKWQKVIGIEIVPEAIADAQYNAKINHLSDRCVYHVWKAEKVIKQWVVDDDFFVGWDVIVVDPPREGMHKDVVQFLIDLKRKHAYRLLYISCNPNTMARDMWLLIDSGQFNLSALQPVDMFPHTHHIEVITVMG